MAYEWVSPLATAATGIAGVAFTWLTSRGGNKTQQALLAAQQQFEVGSQQRTQRLMTFGKFLDQLDAMDRATATAGEAVQQLTDDAEARLRTTDGFEEPEIEGSQWIVAGLNEDETAQLSVSSAGIMTCLGDFDKAFQDLMLCASPETVAAALAVRQDLVEVYKMLVSQADWRFLSSDLRADVVDLMRQDLGYPGKLIRAQNEDYADANSSNSAGQSLPARA